jgi:DNA-binding transcriptional LysR family regulator
MVCDYAIAIRDGIIGSFAVLFLFFSILFFSKTTQMKLDPVSLKLFVAVMEEGTIAKAATREHYAASAVSKRISELEGALHTELFVRSNKGVEATAAAFALLNLARGVLNNLDAIVSQMGEYSTGVRGYVRIMANISAISQFLPDELKSFTVAYPMVRISLQEQVSSIIAKGVAESAAEIGILNAGSYGENVSQLPYHDDELVLVVPDGHPLASRKSVALADALDFDFVGAHTGSAINNQLTKAAAEVNKTLKLRIEVTSFDALCLMVAAGMGVGVMPRGSAQLYLRSLRVKSITLAEPWAKRKLVLCVRSDAVLSSASQLLVDHLREAAR